MLFHYQIKDYFLYCGRVDMRKGIDSLYGIVNNELEKNPITGDVFIFINKKRNQIKMLHWQGDGFAIFYKRLEKGSYEITSLIEEKTDKKISSEQLLFMLQGVVLKSIKKHKRYTHEIVSK